MDVVKAQVGWVIAGARAQWPVPNRSAKEKAAMGATAALIGMSVNWTDCNNMSAHYA